MNKASKETIDRQVKLLTKTPFLRLLCDSVNEIIIILNKERQIVFFNKNLVSALKEDDDGAIEFYGLRPGELFGCIHACDLPGGCGTTEFCGTCGANEAIWLSQQGQTDTQECRIIRAKDGDALDLLVKSTPLELVGEEFTIFTVHDISSEKRRKVLERVFFHDVLNTAMCLQMASELLRNKDPQEMADIQKLLLQSVNELVNEIQSQKTLVAAESRELKVNPIDLEPGAIIDELRLYYDKYAEQNKVRLRVAVSNGDKIDFRTDKGILSRVLGNMVKNAIEASRPEDDVTISYNIKEDRIFFSVHNPSVMTKETQLQLFQRSFSTKGDGRGLGTYSMKLLSERYLMGKIAFDSSEGRGTTFVAEYPKSI